MLLWLVVPCSSLLRGTRSNEAAPQGGSFGLPPLEVPGGWSRHQHGPWKPPYYRSEGTQTSTWSFPEQKPLKFVTYSWSGKVGFNNRVSALQIAFLVAHATGRTLVVPPFLTGHYDSTNHRGSWGKQVPYTAYIAPIEGALGFTEVDFTGRSTLNLDISWGKEQQFTLADIATKYGTATADILNFKFPFGWWEKVFAPSEHKAIAALLNQHVRMAPGIVEGARLLRAHLPSQYGAVHFRLGDRPGESLVDCKDVGFAEHTFGSWRTEEVEKTKKWSDDTEVIYVATNRPEDPRIPKLRVQIFNKKREMRLWEDLPEAARQQALRLAQADLDGVETARDGSLVSCLEQLLSVDAKDYLPAWPSSWDGLVLTMRYTKHGDTANFDHMASALRSHGMHALEPPFVPSGFQCTGAVSQAGHLLLGNSTAAASSGAAADFDVLRGELLEGCGDVCQVKDGKNGMYFPYVEKRIDCPALFANKAIDRAGTWPPPRHIPPALRSDYTMGGSAVVTDHYLQHQQTGRAPVWTTALLDAHMARLRAGTEPGTYGVAETRSLFQLLGRHADKIRGQHCLVLGSMNPWLEAALLVHGAQHVTTVEYAAIQSQDPRVDALTPAQWALGAQYGCVASYSSLEHSGLGRYGDQLNPWGDLQVMSKLVCSSAPRASFFIGMPYGRDEVQWNAHRVYGPRRASQLFANLQVVDSTQGWQRMFVAVRGAAAA